MYRAATLALALSTLSTLPVMGATIDFEGVTAGGVDALPYSFDGPGDNDYLVEAAGGGTGSRVSDAHVNVGSGTWPDSGSDWATLDAADNNSYLRITRPGFSGDLFRAISLRASPLLAQGTDITLRVQGFVDGAIRSSLTTNITLTVGATHPQFLAINLASYNINWSSTNTGRIDELRIKTVGGIDFAVDDVELTAVPEPLSLALFGGGLAALAASRHSFRRRRNPGDLPTES